MKHITLIFLSILLTASAFAQGVNRNGMITTNGSQYVSKNGTIGSITGVNKNGEAVSAVALPEILTTDITALTGTGATSGATITYSGSATVEAKGLCWSTTTKPTILDSKTTEMPDITDFSSTITGLTAKTKYYMRAYITTSDGNVYGDEIVFRTIVPGDDLEGGKVGWIFASGWPEYNKNIQKAFIVRILNNNNGHKWSNTNSDIATLTDNGAGLNNTNAIVADQGDGSYSAKQCYDLSIVDAGVTYDDWFLPSKGDMNAIRGNRAILGMIDKQYMTSSQFSTNIFTWYRGGTGATANNKFYDNAPKTTTAWSTVALRISSAL